MKKLWLVAWHEYRRHVVRKGFVLTLLAVPAVIALSLGLGAYIDSQQNRAAPVGYVDLSGLLADAIPVIEHGSTPDSPGVPAPVPLLAYPGEQAARDALEAGHIQAYYLVAADYRQSRRVDLIYATAPDAGAQRQFWDLLQVNLLRDIPAERAQRAVAGSQLTVRWPAGTPGGSREFTAGNFMAVLLPLFAGVALLVMLISSGGYLMQALVQEKENRTIEILITSLSSGRLIGGKVAGIAAVALTQLAGTMACTALVAWVGTHWLHLGLLQNLSVDWRLLGLIAALGLPTYVFFAALLTAVGATVAQVHEAQQISGLMGLPVVVPFWLLERILENPHGALSMALSFCPVTALTTLSFRLAFTPVPSWQVALGVAVLSLSALGAVWLAGRAFRLGMLRYGQRLRWSEVLQRQRGGQNG